MKKCRSLHGLHAAKRLTKSSPSEMKWMSEARFAAGWRWMALAISTILLDSAKLNAQGAKRIVFFGIVLFPKLNWKRLSYGTHFCVGERHFRKTTADIIVKAIGTPAPRMALRLSRRTRRERLSACRSPTKAAFRAIAARGLDS
jgi:hypothetical protein